MGWKMEEFSEPDIEEMKKKGCINGLFDVLENEEDEEVRKEAAVALGEIGEGHEFLGEVSGYLKERRI